MSVSIEEGRFVYDLEYRKDLFEAESIDYILEKFSMMARGLTESKGAREIKL